RGVGVPSIHTNDWQALVAQLVPQPHSQWTSLHPDASEIRHGFGQPGSNRVRTGRYLLLGENPTLFVDDANGRGFQ
ncbi:hypothetical protein, partial [Pseudorhodoplanes sp.]|uniref:hypothetical protein n=1 Tax=Pseudorhodoplanes sp. TaxID=1934341 RepID=UPI003D137D36